MKGNTMSNEIPVSLEVCCWGNCETEGHPKVVERPLTAEEIAEREAQAAEYAAQQAQAEADAAAKQAEKEAIAARLGLSAEELAKLLS